MVVETVRALCRLAYEGVAEIVVVVDGSTDGTADALARLDCAIPLRVIEQQNRGLAAARNRGARKAPGEILLFLDDDMICEPDLLWHHAHSYDHGADAVIGEFVEPRGPFATTVDKAALHNPTTCDAPICSPFGIYGGHMSVRRSAFEAVGGFDESFTANGRYGYEDCDIAYRLLQQFEVYRNPAAVCEHVKRVNVRQYIGRGRSSAQAEQYLLAKHPELQDELSEWAGASRISKRLRRFVRMPLIPMAFAGAATLVAELGSRTPLRSSAMLLHLCNIAYAVNYWSTVQRTRGIPGL